MMTEFEFLDRLSQLYFPEYPDDSEKCTLRIPHVCLYEELSIISKQGYLSNCPYLTELICNLYNECLGTDVYQTIYDLIVVIIKNNDRFNRFKAGYRLKIIK